MNFCAENHLSHFYVIFFTFENFEFLVPKINLNFSGQWWLIFEDEVSHSGEIRSWSLFQERHLQIRRASCYLKFHSSWRHHPGSSSKQCLVLTYDKDFLFSWSVGMLDIWIFFILNTLLQFILAKYILEWHFEAFGKILT